MYSPSWVRLLFSSLICALHGTTWLHLSSCVAADQGRALVACLTHIWAVIRELLSGPVPFAGLETCPVVKLRLTPPQAARTVSTLPTIIDAPAASAVTVKWQIGGVSEGAYVA